MNVKALINIIVFNQGICLITNRIVLTEFEVFYWFLRLNEILFLKVPCMLSSKQALNYFWICFLKQALQDNLILLILLMIKMSMAGTNNGYGLTCKCCTFCQVN